MDHNERAKTALNRAIECERGAMGALWGAAGLAFTVAAVLGAVGLMLTPLGWALLFIIGAVAGCFGLFKKASNLLSR